MKAVIEVSGNQYLVGKDDEIEVDYLPSDKKTHTFEPLFISDEKSTKVGSPTVKGAKVSAKALEDKYKEDKVTAIRFKAKKRVHKTRGHRQLKTKLKITSISIK